MLPPTVEEQPDVTLLRGWHPVRALERGMGLAKVKVGSSSIFHLPLQLEAVSGRREGLRV